MEQYDVLVLFGSTSDAPVYEPLCALLEEQGWRVDFEVISAHRNPARLAERLAEENFECVVAGAGISAHLPGVIASKVGVPVFGIPVDSQFGGLDAVMSIQMMPRGVPVLCCGPTTWDQFIPYIRSMKQHRTIWNNSLDVVVAESLVGSGHFEKEWARLSDKASSLGIQLQLGHVTRQGRPTIQFVTSKEEISSSPLVIHVPLLTKELRPSIESAIECFNWTSHSGLWVGVNNSINAMHFFERSLCNPALPPVLQIGSVKNLLGDDQSLVFSYSDRYSVFDWGEMPDHIPTKGQCLANMAWMFFDAFGRSSTWKNWTAEGIDEETLAELQRNGLPHHMRGGLVDGYRSSVELGTKTSLLDVHRVQVFKPPFENGVYDYTMYQSKPTQALVPLEIIFRFGVPNGSSLMKRVGDADYLDELGLSTAPKFGDLFNAPIIEYSTKLESTDVYIPREKATEISGLSSKEMHRLTELVRIVAYRLRDIFERTGLVLWDGKLEFAFADVDEQGHRTFQLVDSIGPDELRLTFNGVQLSKECLRKPYRGTDWHDNIGRSKALAKERGQREWKKICRTELQSVPPNLSVSLLEQISGMYQAITNVISEDLYDRRVFESAPTIDVIASQLEQS